MEVKNQSEFTNIQSSESGEGVLSLYYAEDANIVLENITFSQITNALGYGAVYVNEATSLTVTDCSFT
jgi:hypothetical protein